MSWQVCGQSSKETEERSVSLRIFLCKKWTWFPGAPPILPLPLPHISRISSHSHPQPVTRKEQWGCPSVNRDSFSRPRYIPLNETQYYVQRTRCWGKEGCRDGWWGDNQVFKSQILKEDTKPSVKVASYRDCWAEVGVMCCLEFKLWLNQNVQSQAVLKHCSVPENQQGPLLKCRVLGSCTRDCN